MPGLCTTSNVTYKFNIVSSLKVGSSMRPRRRWPRKGGGGGGGVGQWETHLKKKSATLNNSILLAVPFSKTRSVIKPSRLYSNVWS